MSTGSNFNDANDWLDFKTKITALYPTFFDSLKQKHPGLNPKEVKICAMIFSDCDSNKIGKRLEMDHHAVNSARSRIRKKFGLEEEGSLPDYLKREL